MAADEWTDGIRAFFHGEREVFLRKFRASARKAEGSLRARRCLFLAEHDEENAIAYLKEAVRAQPELRQAHVVLCMALEAHQAPMESRRNAVADAIVEADAWSDPRQRPMAFLKGLSSKPWWDEDIPKWVEVLEGLSPKIREHLEVMMPLLHHHDGPQAPWAMVGGDHRMSGSQDGDAVTRGSWNEVVLFGYGYENTDELCQPLVEMLRALLPDAISLAEAGAGEVILSALAPGTDVAPHCARANHRLTAHLGLLVPEVVGGGPHNAGEIPECGISVAGEWRRWQQDKVVVFDDSFEHEVQNWSEKTRVVLLIRFWHPQLGTSERRQWALREIEAMMARSQRVQVLPPMEPFHEPTTTLEAHLMGLSEGLCPCCGSQEGGDLVLDEEQRCVRLIFRCCGEILH
eukprot:symbB.v1.2.009162.t1/scaffold578.1/size184707/3